MGMREKNGVNSLRRNNNAPYVSWAYDEYIAQLRKLNPCLSTYLASGRPCEEDDQIGDPFAETTLRKEQQLRKRVRCRAQKEQRQGQNDLQKMLL